MMDKSICHLGHPAVGQGAQRLGKFLKIKYALKITGKTLKGFEKLPFTVRFNTVFGDLNCIKL